MTYVSDYDYGANEALQGSQLYEEAGPSTFSELTLLIWVP